MRIGSSITPRLPRLSGDSLYYTTRSSDWLIDHSELPEALGRAPTRSHLVHELVESERAFAETAPAAPWHDFYAERIIGRFG